MTDQPNETTREDEIAAKHRVDVSDVRQAARDIQAGCGISLGKALDVLGAMDLQYAMGWRPNHGR